MLEEPTLDAARQTLDRSLVTALTASLAHRRTQGQTRGQTPSPDAEALMLRDLLQQAPDPNHAAILKAVSGRLSALSGTTPVACGPVAQVLAADRFGPCAAVETPEAALEQAGRGARALIDIAAARPWWGRLLARPDLRVTAALPDDADALPRALMVAAARPGPTGGDRTFWVTDASLPDARIVEAMANLGLSARPLAAGGGLKLFLLAGYVQAEDGRLMQAPGSLKGVIGAAAVF